MLMLAFIPVPVAVLSRYVLRGAKQEVVVDLLLIVGFFVSLVVAFSASDLLSKMLVLATLKGLCVKWIRDEFAVLIAILLVGSIGFFWF